MVRMWIAAVAAGLAMLLASGASAQEIERAPAPAWVTPLAPDTVEPPVDDAPIRILAFDQQMRFDAEGVHTYTYRRIRVQTRQGLGIVSTVNGVWNPARQRMWVNSIRIIRGDQVIDVLESQTFETLRRENNLESSMLDGVLTATLQPRDIRVGDILETAFTTSDDGGALGAHRETFVSPNSAFVFDRYRLRATWPADQSIQVAPGSLWPDARPVLNGREWVWETETRNLPPMALPNDLPRRYGLTRIVQFTDFADWRDASVLMAPLFERSATLQPDSPLRAEIERIRAEYPTDAGRAAAALRLVQDQVRYLAMSMGEGNYVPTPADEVWRSRFGDCKGKTVLLLALLHGLGIEAEAVLVSTGNGDGLDRQSPLIAWFDHVIVRAVVDGQTYWLDGARVGDRDLADLTPPAYRWALPVRASGAGMEPIAVPPARSSNFDLVVDVDSSAGLDAEVAMVVDIIYYGDDATSMRERISSVPADQLETVMKSAWTDADEGLTVESVGTRYDEAANSFHLTMRGKSRMSWVESTGGRLLSLGETAIAIPYQDERKGLYLAFKDDPYAISHPFLSRAITRIRLPDGGEGFRLEGGDQTVEGGGYRLARVATIQDGVASVTFSTSSLTNEISAADMAEARRRAENATVPGLRLRAPANYTATAADEARLTPGEDDVETLIERAGRLSDGGDYVGALALLDAAVERESDNAELRLARGGVRLSARDFAGARADYDHAVDLDPADVEALVGQGMVARAEGRFSDAIVSHSVALRLDPSDLQALSARGASYHQIGRWDRSLADYRAFRTAAPGDDVGLFGELRALTRLNRSDEARALITASLTETPQNPVALRALVDLEKAEGSPADALAALDAGVAAAPGDLSLLGLRGETRAAAGDAEGARADFMAMRTRAAGDPLLLNDVCWSQAVAAFDLDRALMDCDGAVVSGEAGVIDSRALVLLQMGRFEEARAAYDQALAIVPTLSSSLYGRGLARLALGDAAGREDISRARALYVDVGESYAEFERRHPELAP